MFCRDAQSARLSSEGAADPRRGWSEAKSPVTEPPTKSNPDGVTEPDAGLAKNYKEPRMDTDLHRYFYN